MGGVLGFHGLRPHSSKEDHSYFCEERIGMEDCSRTLFSAKHFGDCYGFTCSQSDKVMRSHHCCSLELRRGEVRKDSGEMNSTDPSESFPFLFLPQSSATSAAAVNCLLSTLYVVSSQQESVKSFFIHSSMDAE